MKNIRNLKGRLIWWRVEVSTAGPLGHMIPCNDLSLHPTLKVILSVSLSCISSNIYKHFIGLYSRLMCMWEIGLLRHLSLGEDVVEVLAINQEGAFLWSHEGFLPISPSLSLSLEATKAILTFTYDHQMQTFQFPFQSYWSLDFKIPATKKRKGTSL